MPEDGVEYEFFAIISINSFLVYENKNFLQQCLDRFAYEIVDKQMIYYLYEQIFDSD